jgi:translation initiation factor 4A
MSTDIQSDQSQQIADTKSQSVDTKSQSVDTKSQSSVDTKTEQQSSPKNAQSEDKSGQTSITRFEDANLKETLLRGIYAYGWENPSTIQKKGIPAILTGRDVIMQAQSGLGKTGCFTTSLLQRINETEGTIQGVILLPTRELADQVYKVAQAVGDHMKINFIKCVGKSRIQDKLNYPDRCTILIGTPGKLQAVFSKHLIRSQSFQLKCFIIDEFDKMLEEEDFIETIRDIFSHLTKETQVVLSSATVSGQVMEIADQFMRDPIDIAVKTEELTLEGIKQFYVDCDKMEWKFDTILDLYQSLVVAQSIIFVNTKRTCEELYDKFTHKGFSVQALHGSLEQEERDRIMDEFRAGKIRVLLTTDLIARGIDVPGISLVVNYDLPNDNAQYIHRCGRGGRYGKKGMAINLLGNQYDQKRLQGIEQYYSTQILPLPGDFAKLVA